MIKKLFYAANGIVAILAGVDCFLWGMRLPSSTVLWMHGEVQGYIELSLFSLIITAFCIMPSFIIYEHSDN